MKSLPITAATLCALIATPAFAESGTAPYVIEDSPGHLTLLPAPPPNTWIMVAPGIYNYTSPVPHVDTTGLPCGGCDRAPVARLNIAPVMHPVISVPSAHGFGR